MWVARSSFTATDVAPGASVSVPLPRGASTDPAALIVVLLSSSGSATPVVSGLTVVAAGPVGTRVGTVAGGTTALLLTNPAAAPRPAAMICEVFEFPPGSRRVASGATGLAAAGGPGVLALGMRGWRISYPATVFADAPLLNSDKFVWLPPAGSMHGQAQVWVSEPLPVSQAWPIPSSAPPTLFDADGSTSVAIEVATWLGAVTVATGADGWADASASLAVSQVADLASGSGAPGVTGAELAVAQQLPAAVSGSGTAARSAPTLAADAPVAFSGTGTVSRSASLSATAAGAADGSGVATVTATGAFDAGPVAFSGSGTAGYLMARVIRVVLEVVGRLVGGRWAAAGVDRWRLGSARPLWRMKVRRPMEPISAISQEEVCVEVESLGGLVLGAQTVEMAVVADGPPVPSDWRPATWLGSGLVARAVTIVGPGQLPLLPGSHEVWVRVTAPWGQVARQVPGLLRVTP